MNLDRGIAYFSVLFLKILGCMVLMPATFAASIYYKLFFTVSSAM